MTTPLGKADLILGYALAFGALALVQALVATTVLLGLLGLNAPASVPVLLLVAVADALLGTALGLGVSALAATEFQAVQFMPAVIRPQFLLCGLLTRPVRWPAGWTPSAGSCRCATASTPSPGSPVVSPPFRARCGGTWS